jgi:hypothetical protein
LWTPTLPDAESLHAIWDPDEGPYTYGLFGTR